MTLRSQHSSAAHGVKLVELTPGDGYAYRAIVSVLPASFDGGDPGTHVHVSVVSPIRWSWTFSAGGFLHERYVREKMHACAVDDVDRWLPGMLRLLGAALGRETSDPVTS